MVNKFKLKKKKKDKKKKGFTLVELLAVIVILAVIMVITIPTVIGSMNKAKEKSEEIFVASLERSLNKFIENELQYKDYNFDENKEEYIISSIKNEYGYYDVKDKENNPFPLSFLMEKGYINNDSLVNPKSSISCDKNTLVDVSYDHKNDKYYYKVRLSCANITLSTIPGPEEPYFSDGLIPVVYNEIDKIWEVADISSKWYDYDNQIWANAVSVTETSRSKYKNFDKTFNPGTPVLMEDILAMFVWIPRFAYTIGCTDLDGVGGVNTSFSVVDKPTECLGFKLPEASPLSLGTPGAIDIKFVSKDDEIEDPGVASSNPPNYIYDNDAERVPDNWYTHPAFKFNDNELSGFWIGKFENSGSFTKPTILPGKSSLYNGVLKDHFNSSLLFSSTSNYGLSNTNLSSHLTRNSEWAAVVYLSQSIYGKYGNLFYNNEYKEIYKNINNYNKTGYGQDDCYYNNIVDRGNGKGSCGGGASTTGNIYGVYDMNGGRLEYVMGTYIGKMADAGQNFSSYYYDIFNQGKPSGNNPAYIKGIDKTNTGYAFYETVGWYGESSTNMLYNITNPWVIRGALNSSNGEPNIFTHYVNSGIFYNGASRITLS